METRLSKHDRCETAESASGSLHVHLGVAHGGDGTDRLDHMADHVDDGQVDDGPVDNKQSLDAVGHAPQSSGLCRILRNRGYTDSSPRAGGVTGFPDKSHSCYGPCLVRHNAGELT